MKPDYTTFQRSLQKRVNNFIKAVAACLYFVFFRISWQEELLYFSLGCDAVHFGTTLPKNVCLNICAHEVICPN
jgi:hypothetical protein